MHVRPYLALDALYLEDPSLLAVPPREVPPPDVVSVIAMTRYKLNGRELETQEIPLAVGIDSRDWVSAVLSVRVHALKSFAELSRVNIDVENAFLAKEDPSIAFADPTVLAQVAIMDGDPVPFLYTETLNFPIGPMLSVFMRPVIDITEKLQDLTISVSLIGRKACSNAVTETYPGSALGSTQSGPPRARVEGRFLRRGSPMAQFGLVRIVQRPPP